jgi:hypothetical protein
MAAYSAQAKRLAAGALVGAALVAGAGRAGAGSLLLATAERPFGPAGGGMAGIQTALAGSVDALWANPAGLARETRNELYLDAGTLDLAQFDTGGGTAATLSSAPGAAGWATGPNRTRPRYGMGLFLHTPVWQSTSVRLDDSRTVGAAGLPPPVAGTAPYAALFPDGVQRGEHGQGSAALTVVAPGFGLGVRVLDWMRVGASLRLERVSLRLQESFTQDYAAASSAGGTNVLTGVTQSAAQFSGEADRAVLSIGLQMDLGSQLMLGIVSQQPSQQMAGSGQARVERVDQLRVTQNGLEVQQATSFIHVDAERVSFQLRDPGSLRVGLALLFDELVVEMDLEQTRSLAPYEVFPRLESKAPSTTAAQLPALTTRARAVTRYGIAAAFAQGNRGSWFFGFASDPSPVPSGDPIFRKVDFQRFTSGYYVTRGALSGTVRLGFATADAPAVRFPHVTDDDGVTQSVRSTVWSVGLSGTYVY